MPLYRKKPVIIEAVQWDGSDAAMAAIEALQPECRAQRAREAVTNYEGLVVFDRAHDNGCVLRESDWILRDAAGGPLRTATHDAFTAAYEECT